MKLAPLPPSIAACIPTIHWPLRPSSCPPLQYEPLDRLADARSKTKENHSSPKTGTPYSPIDSIASDVPSALEALLLSSDASNGSVKDEEKQRSSATVSLALLLLGNGFVDEAHDLVTPLSWPEPTHFGFGPSLYSTTDASVVSAASYVHSLVHRREAWNVGEYGMTGFSNANYWTRAALTSRGSSSLPWKEVRNAVLTIADSMKDDIEVQKWTQERVREEMDDDHWEPRALHELCSVVLQGSDNDNNSNNSGGGGLGEFAQRAAEAEVHVLLQHCFQSAGFDYSVNDDYQISKKANYAVIPQDDSPCPTLQVDETISLASANKISSAHANAFQRDGFVVLRGVVKLDGNDDAVDERVTFSAMAGIAARLLDSQACCLVNSDDIEKMGPILRIMLPTTKASAVELSNGAIGGGGSLAPGDAFASIIVNNDEHISNSDSMQVNERHLNKFVRDFVACEPDNSKVIFVDKLYGGRGETPTTVVQWSKGTIF